MPPHNPDHLFFGETCSGFYFIKTNLISPSKVNNKIKVRVMGRDHRHDADIDQSLDGAIIFSASMLKFFNHHHRRDGEGGDRHPPLFEPAL